MSNFSSKMKLLFFFNFLCLILCLWVPVTTTLRVLRLRMEERPPIWMVAANVLDKQLRTADMFDCKLVTLHCRYFKHYWTGRGQMKHTIPSGQTNL